MASRRRAKSIGDRARRPARPAPGRRAGLRAWTGAVVGQGCTATCRRRRPGRRPRRRPAATSGAGGAGGAGAAGPASRGRRRRGGRRGGSGRTVRDAGQHASRAGRRAGSARRRRPAARRPRAGWRPRPGSPGTRRGAARTGPARCRRARRRRRRRTARGCRLVHAPTPIVSRRRIRPSRMRVLAVPTGRSSMRGHLRVRVAPEVGELQRLALDLGQGVERRRGPGVPRSRPGRPRRSSRARPRWLLLVVRRVAPGARPRPSGPGRRPCGARCVSSQRDGAAPRRVEPAGGPPDLQERLLGDLLGLGRVADDAHARARRPGPTSASYSCGEGGLVAAADALEQLGEVGRVAPDGAPRSGRAAGTGLTWSTSVILACRSSSDGRQVSASGRCR